MNLIFFYFCAVFKMTMKIKKSRFTKKIYIIVRI